VSFLVFGLIAAACGASALAATAVLRKRLAPPALPPASETPDKALPPALKPHPELPVFIDHVIQVGDETRWPRSGMLVNSGGIVRAAILLSEEGDEDQATVALPPPDRSLLWLKRVELAMPPSPPTRVEIDGFLLDREELLPVTLEAVGRPHVAVLEGEAQLARYRGQSGDEALVIVHGSEVQIWYGQVLEPGEFDSLGRVDEVSS